MADKSWHPDSGSGWRAVGVCAACRCVVLPGDAYVRAYGELLCCWCAGELPDEPEWDDDAEAELPHDQWHDPDWDIPF
jgi:hypothetical protein